MDIAPLTAGQNLTTGVLNLLFAAPLLLFTPAGGSSGGLQPGGSWAVVAVGIIYTGMFSLGLGYALQARGQRDAPTSDAAVILSMESVFAALAGWLILGETLAPIQLLGCGLILGAVVLVQMVGESTG
jgi:drug/metabolite transporter (DMT)-like permease